MYRFMTLALAIVAIAGVAGCGNTPERLNAHQQRNVDRTPPDVYAMPDHYNNVASKCDGHGHRMYVTSNKDQAPARCAAPRAPARPVSARRACRRCCAGAPRWSAS